MGDSVNDVLSELLTTRALLEFAVLGGCLLGAYAVVWLLRGKDRDPSSIWFGRRGVDGLLFPALALIAAALLRWLLNGHMPLAVFRLAVPILASLLIIRVAVRAVQAAFPHSAFVHTAERTLSWFVWIGMVLWVTGLLPGLLADLDDIRWRMGGVDISVRALLEGGLSAVAVLLAMLWISRAIESRLLRGATGNLSARKIAANATRALLLLVGFLFAMTAAGIPLTALSVLGGAVGVGIGFGLQKLAANYVSGFVILAENSVRIGDMVKVDNFEGRITDIKTRYTVIRALNGRESIVPNELLITQRVENASLADPSISIPTTVLVAYGTDLDMLMPRLLQAVVRVPRVMADPGPSVFLSAFAADGLELTVTFWCGDPLNGQNNVKSDVNLAILATINANGVEIPFPQRVLRRAVTIPARPA